MPLPPTSAGWPNVPVVTGPGRADPAGRGGRGGNRPAPAVGGQQQRQHRGLLRRAERSAEQSREPASASATTPPAPDQTAPAVVCGPDQRVFACWTDWRHTGATDTDTDLYVAELRSGTAGTNILVGDDGTNANQGDPAIGVDRYGEPYLVWTDYRRTTTEIYSAATTLIDPNPLDSKVVVASAGATIGTDPAAINGPEDVSIIVPAGACQADLRMAISRILNPQISSEALLGSYDFGPSGSNFEQRGDGNHSVHHLHRQATHPALLVRFRDRGAQSTGDHRCPEPLYLHQVERAAVPDDALHAVLSGRCRCGRCRDRHGCRRRLRPFSEWGGLRRASCSCPAPPLASS